MKKLVGFFLVFSSVFGYTQNQTYSTVKPVARQMPVEESKSLFNSLSNKEDINKKEYFEFIEEKTKRLHSNDLNSIEYKSEKYALDKYKEKLRPYIEKSEMSYATNVLFKAKLDYYDDIIIYKELNKEESKKNSNQKDNNNLIDEKNCFKPGDIIPGVSEGSYIFSNLSDGTVLRQVYKGENVYFISKSTKVNYLKVKCENGVGYVFFKE